MKKIKFPIYSAIILGVITFLCIIMPVFSDSPTRMDFNALNKPPSVTHLFGTDPLGRDIFKMIWYGGFVSLFIGLFSTIFSTLIAMIYGTISGLSGKVIDTILMRFVEMLLCVPTILYVVIIQAILGKPSVTSIAVVIGLTSWLNMAKMVRSEVLRIRRTEYILSAQHMGGGFIYVLRRHLLPNFIPAILFMIVSNVASAIAVEATLSFMGIGLPTTVVSWGSLMSLSQKVLLTGSWWIISIPGIFLVTTLVCITNIGEYYRKKNTI